MTDKHAKSPIPPKPNYSAELGIRVKMAEEGIKELERLHKTMAYKVSQLDRKARGTTRANGEAARLATEVAILQAHVKNLKGNAHAEPASESYMKTLNTRIDITKANFEKALQDMQAVVEGHTGILNGHRTELDMLNAGQLSHSQRTDNLERRISVIDGGGEFPLIRLLISIVVGIIAGFIWGSINFRDVLKVPYTNDVPVVYTFAASPWAAVFFGVAIGSIVLGLLMLFPVQPRKSKEEVETSEMTTTETTHEVAPPAASNHPTTPATTVQPVAAGNGGH